MELEEGQAHIVWAVGGPGGQAADLRPGGLDARGCYLCLVVDGGGPDVGVVVKGEYHPNVRVGGQLR